MNNHYLNQPERIIRETFNDTRKIKCVTPEYVRRLDDNVHPGGVIFTTENGEFIDFEIQFEDFDEYELAKYIEFAENLYEKHQKHVSVYLLCPLNINVSVRECPIKSDADFTIKLACSEEDPCHIILNQIKHKISQDILLDDEDYNVLDMLPVKCARKDRNYFRVETLKIINGHYP